MEENPELKKESRFKDFIKPNLQKIILFLAILILVPLPFYGGLVGGFASFQVYGFYLFSMLLSSIVYGAWLFILIFFLQLLILPLFSYFLACFSYKGLLFINKRKDYISWISIIVFIILLALFYILVKGGSVSA